MEKIKSIIGETENLHKEIGKTMVTFSDKKIETVFYVRVLSGQDKFAKYKITSVVKKLKSI